MLDVLTQRWKERAEYLRQFGGPAAEPLAEIWERAADEHAAAMVTYLNEDLSLTDGARETGYSPDHLGRFVRRGRIRNVGRRNAPRIRRGDLPFKPGVLRAQLAPSSFESQGKSQIARSIIDSQKEANDGA